MHSEINFSVKHLMISKVSGHFQKFDATLVSEKEDFTDAKIEFEADINSISTHNEQRDGHLKSPDFFNAEVFPKLKFSSTALKHISNNLYKLEGTLHLRDKTNPITMDVEYSGKMVDFYGNEKHGFELNGKISRKEFGLEWNAVTEAGGVVVSDEVKLQINAQFQKN